MVDVDLGRTRGLVQTTGALDRKPELALMVAVLEDAIACYNGTISTRRENPTLLRRQARRWLESTDWNSPFSFNYICEALDLDPRDARRKIIRSEPLHAPAHAA